ncbi:undecaprenyl-diphosphatase [Marinospirillum minutulum]|uniref:undecaprenyl-diphosphatase n=1 Tax=Marinospirillum minutulum TaxID=64974 RepID=UPI000406AB11|nr:undecaprenyl-diphosphatase [Marinospirillum minutulum]
MDSLNSDLFLAINQLAGENAILDASAIFIAEVMPFILIGVMVSLWFFADLNKKRISFFAGYSVLLALLLSYLIGVFYFHPRPFVLNLGSQLVEHAADTSFPSDHTTFIFAIASSYLFSRETLKLGVLLVLLSFLAGLARVFVGVHFPFDIIGAGLVGVVSSLSIKYLANKTDLLESFFQLFRVIQLPKRLVNKC